MVNPIYEMYCNKKSSKTIETFFCRDRAWNLILYDIFENPCHIWRRRVKLRIFNYLAGYDFMILLVNNLIFHDTKFIHIHPDIQLLHRGKTNSSGGFPPGKYPIDIRFLLTVLLWYFADKKRSWRNGAKCTRFLESGKSSPESCVIFNDTNSPTHPKKTRSLPTLQSLEPPLYIYIYIGLPYFAISSNPQTGTHEPVTQQVRKIWRYDYKLNPRF